MLSSGDVLCATLPGPALLLILRRAEATSSPVAWGCSAGDRSVMSFTGEFHAAVEFASMSLNMRPAADGSFMSIISARWSPSSA